MEDPIPAELRNADKKLIKNLFVSLFLIISLGLVATGAYQAGRNRRLENTSPTTIPENSAVLGSEATQTPVTPTSAQTPSSTPSATVTITPSPTPTTTPSNTPKPTLKLMPGLKTTIYKLPTPTPTPLIIPSIKINLPKIQL